MHEARQPALERIDHVHDIGNGYLFVTGWDLGSCVTGCPCHRHPDSGHLAIHEDPTRGRLRLVSPRRRRLPLLRTLDRVRTRRRTPRPCPHRSPLPRRRMPGGGRNLMTRTRTTLTYLAAVATLLLAPAVAPASAATASALDTFKLQLPTGSNGNVDE